jgi:hypothetical protein
MGQTSPACTGSATTATWLNAVAYCENLSLAGRTDWRLPSINELKTIVDVNSDRFGQAIDTVYFPGTVAGEYWSSTALASYPAITRYVNFGVSYPGGNQNYRTTNYQVRCVAGP